jgi:hypothetical protein
MTLCDIETNPRLGIQAINLGGPHPLIPDFAGLLVLAVHLHDDAPKRRWGNRLSNGKKSKGENTWPFEQAANS